MATAAIDGTRLKRQVNSFGRGGRGRLRFPLPIEVGGSTHRFLKTENGGIFKLKMRSTPEEVDSAVRRERAIRGKLGHEGS